MQLLRSAGIKRLVLIKLIPSNICCKSWQLWYNFWSSKFASFCVVKLIYVQCKFVRLCKFELLRQVDLVCHSTEGSRIIQTLQNMFQNVPNVSKQIWILHSAELAHSVYSISLSSRKIVPRMPSISIIIYLIACGDLDLWTANMFSNRTSIGTNNAEKR